MPKARSNNTRQVEVLPSVTPEQGLTLINKQIANGQTLLSQQPVSSAKYSAWEAVTRDFLSKTFGSLSPNVSSVMGVGKTGAFPMGAGENWWERHHAESLSKQITIMEGLREVLQTEISLDTPSSNAARLPIKIPASARSVFLVHGQDSAAENLTARFIEKLELKLIVLHEQPSQGRTIIEKFQDYANVAFAVVLLTPDDRGGPRGAAFDSQNHRARQNVIFELGYFIGRLGRNRVCALYTEGVEIPSDYSGVVFIKFDEAGAWRLKLAREFKAAEIDVDMNKAL
jgi:predicted nucleotide-binding protein